MRVEVVQQLHDLRVGHPQITVENAVPMIRPLPHADHQITPIVRHVPAEAPLLLIRPLVNQRVLRLRGADTMIKKLLKIIRALQRFARFRLLVTAVKKALAVLRPGRAGELDPLQFVRQIRPRPHVAHLPLLPVRAGHGQPVRHEISVLTEAVATQRHRAIGRQFVWIEQHARFGLKGVGHVQHRLILQPVVLRKKVTPALFERHPVALVIPQFLQARPQLRALRQLLEIPERHAILRLDPRFGLGRIVILQPAIRIGDRHAVININLIRAGGRRIIHSGGNMSATHRRENDSGRNQDGKPKQHWGDTVKQANKRQSHSRSTRKKEFAFAKQLRAGPKLLPSLNNFPYG